jgi:hypothetical protein
MFFKCLGSFTYCSLRKSEHFSARLSYNIRVEARTEPDFVIWKIEEAAATIDYQREPSIL